jgi:RHS repeat-associated protein
VGRLTAIAQGSTGVTFGYDSDSRRISMTLPNGILATYGYDAASQLTGIIYQGGSLGLQNLSYTYDLDGRRVGVSGSLASTQLPSAVSSAVYNADNQLTQWGSATLTYDLNGNTINDSTNTYTWDARNRLASADNSAASFVYDALGRRMSKTIQGLNTSFLYDGLNPVQELNGTTPTVNMLTGMIDERFTRTASTGTLDYLTDALGSTIALTDSTGNSQVQYSYDPYGNMNATGSTTNSYTYTGREIDGLGIYYYRTRYYNPQIGRFITEDPIGFLGGINEYTYVGDNPMDFFDPFGLDKKAPNNGTPWYKNPCVQSALAKGAASTAIDAVGLLPEGGAVAGAFSLWHGAAGVSNGIKILQRVKFGAGIISAASAGSDASQDGALSLAGAQLATGFASIGAGLAKAAPIVGQALSAASVLEDLYGTYQAVAACHP